MIIYDTVAQTYFFQLKGQAGDQAEEFVYIWKSCQLIKEGVDLCLKGFSGFISEGLARTSYLCLEVLADNGSDDGNAPASKQATEDLIS